MTKNYKNPVTDNVGTGNCGMVENVTILAVCKKLDFHSGFILNHFVEIEKSAIGKWMLDNIHEYWYTPGRRLSKADAKRMINQLLKRGKSETFDYWMARTYDHANFFLLEGVRAGGKLYINLEPLLSADDSEDE